MGNTRIQPVPRKPARRATPKKNADAIIAAAARAWYAATLRYRRASRAHDAAQTRCDGNYNIPLKTWRKYTEASQALDDARRALTLALAQERRAKKRTRATPR